MKIKSKLFLLLPLTCLMACSQDPSDVGAKLEKRMDEDAKFVDARINKLETELKALVLENKSLKVEMAALAPDTESLKDQVKAALDEEVDALITTRLDETVGAKSNADTLFTQQFGNHIAAYEQQKEAAAQAAKEVREAEEAERRVARDAERFAGMTKDLGLNDDQSVQLFELGQGMKETFRGAMREMYQGGSFDREAFGELRNEAVSLHREEASKIISGEQLETYLKTVERFMGPGRGRGRP
jgi:hypothetical protein